MNLPWLLGIGLPILGFHLLSVTLTRALRSYSRSRLEAVCERQNCPGRADEIAHDDEASERGAEALAVVTGLTLAALLGVAVDQHVPSLAAEAVLPIALAVGGLGYVLAGVVGRVFAERLLVSLWPAATAIKVVTRPLTFLSRQVEVLFESFAGDGQDAPRPASFELEIPSNGDRDEDADADLSDSTRELLEHAVALTRRDVSELMTPRSAIVMLSAASGAKTAARVFRESGRSRMPLYGENRDDVVGILYAKDLFGKMTEAANPEAEVVPRSLVRPAYCVPQTKNAYDLLEEFRAQRTQIALVLDEYGGLAGLVTLEDLVEELVGPIDDEHDVPTPADLIVPLGGSRYEVDGGLDLESLNDRLGLRLPTDRDYITVGGFAFHALGRLPEPGDTFRYEGTEVRVLEISDHSIKRVRIDLQPAEAVES